LKEVEDAKMYDRLLKERSEAGEFDSAVLQA
jgi:hypothetical protein